MGMDPKSLLDRHPKLGQGIILQEPQDPDKLPEPFPFFSLRLSETTAKGVKTLGQVQIHQGPGMIHGTRFSFQKG
jgi:hypothetical protein